MKKIIGFIIVCLFIGTSTISVFGQVIKKNLNDISNFSINSSTLIGNIFGCSSKLIINSSKEAVKSKLSLSDISWIKYNDGYTENSFGLPGGGTICEAIQLTDAELSDYRGYSIWEIKVSIGCDKYGPEPGISYQVWIQNTQPTDPTTANIIATGLSTGDVWEEIWLAPYRIYATGDVWVGVNFINLLPGDYPCGFDETTNDPIRGGYLWASGFGWTTLNEQGYPSVWGLDVGVYPCCSPPYIPSDPTPSNHATGVDINADLSWLGGDPDNDIVTYDVYFEAGDSTPDELVSYHQSGVTFDSGTMNAYTKYYWQIVSIDNYGYISTGPIWDFITSSESNKPPYIPSEPHPENDAINTATNIVLTWSGGDPNVGDTVTYDVYFGSWPPFEKIAHHISNTSINPGNLTNNLSYCWSVTAWDNHGSWNSGPLWDFTTGSEPNNPPTMPNSPYPENQAINIPTNIVLNWSGGDPNFDDTITYDVYFGGMLPIQKIASNITNTSINPGNLVKGLTYFWNVVAWDNHDVSTLGPSWHFTTINFDNRPPNKPNIPSGNTSGKKGITYFYISSTTDPDNDDVYYLFDWGDVTDTGWVGPCTSGDNVTCEHSWVIRGTYPVKIQAMDIHGNKSVWSDPLVINMPKTYIYNPFLELLAKVLERFPFFEKILKQEV